MPPMNGNGPILRERVHPALILYPVAHLAVEIYNSMVSIMWPLFRERFGLSFSAVGILTLIFRGSMTLPQMPFAALGDRRGTRWLGIGGLALMAVGMGLVGLAPSIPLLVLVLALAPLGSAAVHPAGTSHVSSVLTRSRGAAVAVFMIGGTIGGALGPLLGGWLYERHGLAASPWLTPLGLAIALAMFFWLPAQEHSPTRPAQPGPGQVRIPPAMYLLVAACMGVSWVENGLNSYLPLLYSGRGLPLMAASQALFAMTAASTGGILVGGLLSDRMPRWRIIVAAELRYGAAKKGSPRLTAQVEAVLGAIEVLPFEEPADRAYGALRVRLEQKGLPMGGNDLLIAAQAISLGFTLVTANEREFARVDDLHCENWLT